MRCEYPKIETLYERGENHIITDVLKRPIFADISRWVVTEKVDGTNIRIGCTKGDDTIFIGGRTNNAQIPGDLIKHLLQTFLPEKMQRLFHEEAPLGTSITLYGEGYGPGIQKVGSLYRNDKSFILFDVMIENEGKPYWQTDEVVTHFADLLDIERVPILGEWDLSRIRDKVSLGVPSVVAMRHKEPGSAVVMAEGIVARPCEPLFDRRGNRLILKLKTKDFTGGK